MIWRQRRIALDIGYESVALLETITINESESFSEDQLSSLSELLSSWNENGSTILNTKYNSLEDHPLNSICRYDLNQQEAIELKQIIQDYSSINIED